MNTRTSVCVVCALLLAAFSPSRAEQPSRDKTLLSGNLPVKLAEWVQRTGTDRPLSLLTAEQIDTIKSETPDPLLMADILRPTGAFDVAGPVTIVRTEQPSAVASDALILAATNVELADGATTAFGGEIPIGAVVVYGLIINAGNSNLVIDDVGERIVLIPGQAFLSGCARECSVTCSTGNYACCTVANGCAQCFCVANGTSTSCEAGGPNATACSISRRELNAGTGGVVPE